MQLEAFICWTETKLAPRVWAIRDDVRKCVQRSDELVRMSRALVRRHWEKEQRQGAYGQPYVLELSTVPDDKLLAVVNRDLERTVDALPDAYHRACWTWFNSLSPVNRITADLASRVYLDGDAAAARRIAAELPRAPAFPFPPAGAAPTRVSRADRRSRPSAGRQRSHG